MSNDAADLLVGASMDFLRNFSPFNRMEPGALASLAERAVLAFHARGSEILTPESGVPSHFYIVQRGKIQARQTGQTTVTEYTSLTLGPGECFPIGAISARRPSTNAYVAVEDSFCFQISADDFLHLMQISRCSTSSARSTSPACSASRASSCRARSPSAPPSSRP